MALKKKYWKKEGGKKKDDITDLLQGSLACNARIVWMITYVNANEIKFAMPVQSP